MAIKSKLRIGLAFAVVVVLMVAASRGRAEISRRDTQALSKTGLIYIATVRKDGNQSRAAPVWFTTSADNKAVLISNRTRNVESQAHQAREPGYGVDRIGKWPGLYRQD
jgi:hypothetical protein